MTHRLDDPRRQTSMLKFADRGRLEKTPVSAPPAEISRHVLARAQKAPLVFFQNKAGQAAGRIGSSVDSDSIGADLWGDRRRVPVHNEFAMLRLTGDERLTNSEQIIAYLAIEGHAGPYTGMAKEIVANGLRNLERF